jgi:hypothetical protein
MAEDCCEAIAYVEIPQPHGTGIVTEGGGQHGSAAVVTRKIIVSSNYRHSVECCGMVSVRQTRHGQASFLVMSALLHWYELLFGDLLGGGIIRNRHELVDPARLDLVTCTTPLTPGPVPQAISDGVRAEMR